MNEILKNEKYEIMLKLKICRKHKDEYIDVITTDFKLNHLSYVTIDYG